MISAPAEQAPEAGRPVVAGLAGLTVDGIQLQGTSEILAGLLTPADLNADGSEGIQRFYIKWIVLEDIQIGLDGIVGPFQFDKIEVGKIFAEGDVGRFKLVGLFIMGQCSHSIACLVIEHCQVVVGLGEFGIDLEEVLNLAERFIRLHFTNIGNDSLVGCPTFNYDKTM